jgi:hypothetical protein
MTMYLPNGAVRPTGYEACEFIEPPADSRETSVTATEDNEEEVDTRAR